MTSTQLPEEIAQKVRDERKKMAAHLEACAVDLRASDNTGDWNNWAFELSRVSSALRNCGSRARGFMIYDHAPEKNAATRHRCRNRLCPFCHAVNASHVADVLERLIVEELDKGSELASLTLTIRHRKHEPLKLLRKTLDKAWANFTKRVVWKTLVKDYHRKAELERTIANGWHPHFHSLIKFTQFRDEANARWRADTLRKWPLFKAWAKFRRANGLPVEEAAFVTMNKSEIQDLLRWEWLQVTSALGRASKNIRLEWVKPVAGQPGMVWGKEWDKSANDYKPVIKPIRKVAQEMAKYDTKRSATGSKRGQQGIYDYSPAELVEYLRGMKNWHLHQSSKAWSIITKTYLADDAAADAEEASREGGHYVPYVELVKDAQDAVAGVMPRQLLLAFCNDAFAVLDVLDKEHAADPDFSPRQARALRSHLGRLYGDDQSELEEFPLLEHEKYELQRLRGVLVERKCTVTIETEEPGRDGVTRLVKKKVRGRRAAIRGDYREDYQLERDADDAAREAAAQQAQREIFAERSASFGWSPEVETQYRELSHA